MLCTQMKRHFSRMATRLFFVLRGKSNTFLFILRSQFRFLHNGDEGECYFRKSRND